MVTPTGIPESLAATLVELIDRAPDDDYRADLLVFAQTLAAIAGHADVHKRLARYADLLGIVDEAKTKKNPLADPRHCVRLVATTVEILRELTGSMPKERDVVAALTESGIPYADRIVSVVWRGNPRFHAEWLGLLPRVEPLGEALRRAG